MLRLLVFAVFVALTCAEPRAAFADDWGACADDVNRLQWVARVAADAATNVKSRAEDLEQCKRDRAVYENTEDRCGSKASQYRFALSEFERELDKVNRQVRAISSSCGVDLPAVERPAGSSLRGQGMNDSMCGEYRRYKGKLPLEKVFKVCVETWGDVDCKRCLSQ